MWPTNGGNGRQAYRNRAPHVYDPNGFNAHSTSTKIERERQVYDYSNGTGVNGLKGLELSNRPEWIVSDWFEGTEDKIVPVSVSDLIFKIVFCSLLIAGPLYIAGVDLIKRTESTSVFEALSRIGTLSFDYILMYAIMFFIPFTIALGFIGKPVMRKAPKSMVAVSVQDLKTWLNADKIMVFQTNSEYRSASAGTWGGPHTTTYRGDCNMVSWDPEASTDGFWMLFWSPAPNGRGSRGSLLDDRPAASFSINGRSSTTGNGSLIGLIGGLMRGGVGSAMADAAEWPMWVQTSSDKIRVIVDRRYFRLDDWMMSRKGNLINEMMTLQTAENYLTSIRLPRNPARDPYVRLKRGAALMRGAGRPDPRRQQ